MTSILSAISGHFSKSLILGTFLPVVVFVILGLVFVAPLLPPDLAALGRLRAIDNLDAGKLVAITLAAVVLSGLLYNLNIPIMRLYEGYPWAGSLLGRRLTRRQQATFDALRAREEGMRVLRDELAAGPDAALAAEFGARQIRLEQRLKSEFPGNRTSVLPTRFGNVIRSFEDYPRRQYGISAITVWPRLIAKIDKEYAAAVDDSKTSLDFMMNGSALAGVFAAALLALGLVHRAPLADRGRLAAWLAQVAASAVLSYLMYVGATNRAAAYGSKIKSAFDLYRWALLKQLGYQYAPSTVEDERALWENISRFMIYGAPPRHRARLAGYKSPQAAGDQTPRMMLDTHRGVTPGAAATGELIVHVSVRNVSDTQAAKGVVVADALPDGFDYVWASESVDAGSVSVAGANPYRFSLGDMAAGERRVVTYRAVPRKKP